MSNYPAKYGVLIKQCLRSNLDRNEKKAVSCEMTGITGIQGLKGSLAAEKLSNI